MARKREKKGFFKEFKVFITRGNVMDLAVGLIIGNAFTSIVKSLTNDVIMPIVGKVIGGVDFTALRIPLWKAEQVVIDGQPQYDQFGQVLYNSAIYYGRFIQAIFDFLLIAFVVFLIIKSINLFHERAINAKEKLFHKEKEAQALEEAVEEPIEKEVIEPVLPEDILLLREIRDLLKKE